MIRDSNDDGVQINMRRLPRGAKRPEDPKGESSRVEQLFEALGTDGLLTVNRVLDNGKLSYYDTIPVDDDLVHNLEERVAERFGGGHWLLVGRKGRTYVGSTNLIIDERAHPPKLSEKERKELEAGEKRAGQTSGDLSQLLMMQQQQADKHMRETRELLSSQVQMAQQSSQQTLALTLGMMQTMASMFAQQHGGKGPDIAGTLGQMSQLFKLVDTIRPPAPEAAPTSMAERIAAMAIGPIALKVGDVVAGQIGQMGQQPSQPAPAPALTPASGPGTSPGAPGPTAAPLPAGPPPQAAAPPPLPEKNVIPMSRRGTHGHVRPYSPEELAKERERRRGAQTVARPPVAPAPRAAAVVPRDPVEGAK